MNGAKTPSGGSIFHPCHSQGQELISNASRFMNSMSGFDQDSEFVNTNTSGSNPKLRISWLGAWCTVIEESDSPGFADGPLFVCLLFVFVLGSNLLCKLEQVSKPFETWVSEL